jgi:hypothetical protein
MHLSKLFSTVAVFPRLETFSAVTEQSAFEERVKFSLCSLGLSSSKQHTLQWFYIRFYRNKGTIFRLILTLEFHDLLPHEAFEAVFRACL